MSTTRIRIVADCFDDWRRSNIFFTVLHLRRAGLPADEHLEEISDQVKDTLEAFTEW